MKTLLLALALAPQDSELDRFKKELEKSLDVLKDMGRKAQRWFEGLMEPRRAPPKPEPKPVEKPVLKAKLFAPDPFESWNAVGVGSSVEFEMEAGGSTMTIVKTLDAKGPERMTLQTVVSMNKTSTRNEEPVVKDRGGLGDAKCPLCSKSMREHPDRGSWASETVQVNGREIACGVYTSADKNCKGDAQPKTRTWYSAEVPGGIVRIEAAQFRMRLLRYKAVAPE